MTGPDGEKFVWGRIVEIHNIGPYYIVEFQPWLKVDGQRTTAKFSSFHPYVTVNRRVEDTRTCAKSLDGALVLALAYKNDGPGSHAGHYACKVLGIPVE